jgi:hypothetical protein
MSNHSKAFNATREGQMKMAYDADSIGTALTMNRAIKAKGGAGWDESWIQTANPVLLASIKEDLRREWNSLVKS